MVYFMIVFLREDVRQNTYFEEFYPPAIGFIVVLLANQIRTEWVQFLKSESKMRYFTNYWNLIDLVYLTLNLSIIVRNLLGAFFDIGDNSSDRVVASVSAIFLWSKVLDWLRLFDGTAFYIFLIKITIRDIG